MDRLKHSESKQYLTPCIVIYEMNDLADIYRDWYFIIARRFLPTQAVIIECSLENTS